MSGALLFVAPQIMGVTKLSLKEPALEAMFFSWLNFFLKLQVRWSLDRLAYDLNKSSKDEDIFKSNAINIMYTHKYYLGREQEDKESMDNRSWLLVGQDLGWTCGLLGHHKVDTFRYTIMLRNISAPYKKKDNNNCDL